MLLLDPLLAIPPAHPSGTLTSSPEFWQRILDWANDKRVFVGAESHAVIYEAYARHGYPEQSLDIAHSPSRREYQAALSSLLSRIQRHTFESGERDFTPEYAGSAEISLALQLDLSGTAGTPICAVATSDSHWRGGIEETLRLNPPPPSDVEMCCVAGAELRAESRAKIQNFFAGKRLHIVGGQVDSRVITALCDRLALDPGDIEWLPCEKSKPPRDLEKRWSKLDPARDLTVCITGRVGHATSMLAAKAARKSGASHLLAEFGGDIEKSLVDFAMTDG